MSEKRYTERPFTKEDVEILRRGAWVCDQESQEDEAKGLHDLADRIANLIAHETKEGV